MLDNVQAALADIKAGHFAKGMEDIGSVI